MIKFYLGANIEHLTMVRGKTYTVSIYYVGSCDMNTIKST